MTTPDRFHDAVPMSEIKGTDKPEVIEELQSSRPVCPVSLDDGEGAWLVTGYEEVRTVLTDPRFRRDPNITGNRSTAQPVRHHTTPQMRSLEMNGHPHAQLRGIVSKSFSRRAVEESKPTIHRFVGQALDELEAAGPPADLTQFARAFPVAVISDIIGISLDDSVRTELRHWTEASLSMGKYADEDVQTARVKLFEVFKEELDRKAANLRGDLLSTLVRAFQDGTLSELEMIRLAITVFVAGHETTVNAVGLGMARLFEHSAQLEDLKSDPDLIDRTVEELLRFQFHPTVGVDRRRFAAAPVALSACEIQSGDTVIVSINAANQDPTVFERPHEVDIHRMQNPHLSFGDGEHYCLGAALARAELRIALTELNRRFPTLRPAAELTTVRRRRGLLVGGVESLPVTW